MMNQVEIREIRNEAASEYKSFFMSGLVESASSFRISAKDELTEEFPTADRFDSFTFGAYMNNNLVGVVSFARDGARREKLRHKGILFRMYVTPDARGVGIGKHLMKSVIARVRSIDGIEQINLTVVEGNESAISLYKKLGFVTFAREHKAIRYQGVYFDELQMVLAL